MGTTLRRILTVNGERRDGFVWAGELKRGYQEPGGGEQGSEGDEAVGWS